MPADRPGNGRRKRSKRMLAKPEQSAVLGGRRFIPLSMTITEPSDSWHEARRDKDSGVSYAA
jgi:hypothetical protein